MKSNSLIIILLFLIQLFAFASSTKIEIKDFYKPLDINYTGKVFSGFLNTDIPQNELFYMFFPSQKQNKDKVVVWFNGGPGCSSLIGLLTENGPVVTELYSNIFHLNQYSWNNEASVIYLEAPAGVGFSKTANPEQKFTEAITAKGTLAALNNFFQNEFPDYIDSELYFSGESYAGVYIPFLVQEIYAQADNKLNLKGVLIGNGLVDYEVDAERSMVQFGYGLGIIAPELINEFEMNCPHLNRNDLKPRNVTPKCNEIRRNIRSCFDGYDIYGIYRQCNKGKMPAIDQSWSYQEAIKRTFNKIKQINMGYEMHMTNDETEEEISIWPKLCDSDMSKSIFLNLEETKEKIEIDKTFVWNSCSDKVGDNYIMTEPFAVYRDLLLKKNLRVWFFSGDTDAVLSTKGSMLWVNKLNLKTVSEYKAWKCQGQIAGFYQEYENNFTFITVKGAGHMVPDDKKPEAKAILDAFLNGKF